MLLPAIFNGRAEPKFIPELAILKRELSVKNAIEVNEHDVEVMALGAEAGDARAQIEPWILKATAFANKAGNSYGYSVLNGGEIPEELVKVIRLSEGEHEILLASDGYPVLKPTLQQSEQELERIMKDDPQCCRLYESTKGLKPGNKSFDDRTYVRFRVGTL